MRHSKWKRFLIWCCEYSCEMCYEKWNKKRTGKFFSNKRFLKTNSQPSFLLWLHWSCLWNKISNGESNWEFYKFFCLFFINKNFLSLWCETGKTSTIFQSIDRGILWLNVQKGPRHGLEHWHPQCGVAYVSYQCINKIQGLEWLVTTAKIFGNGYIECLECLAPGVSVSFGGREWCLTRFTHQYRYRLKEELQIK